MTKAHIEFCPHCGEKPIYNVHHTPDSVHGPAEYDEEIYCNNSSCIPNQSLESWNTRVNKEAEFLEELKYFVREKILKVNLKLAFEPCSMRQTDSLKGERHLSKEILRKIEQFQAEQKANNENN